MRRRQCLGGTDGFFQYLLPKLRLNSARCYQVNRAFEGRLLERA
jgi:hypothetical protein